MPDEVDRPPRLLSGAARGGDTISAAYTTTHLHVSRESGCVWAVLCMPGLCISAPLSLLVELSVLVDLRLQLSRRASLSFHLPAHTMSAMKGQGDTTPMCKAMCIGWQHIPCTDTPLAAVEFTRPCRALHVLNLPSFRSMEHTAPSASNHTKEMHWPLLPP